MGLAEDAARTSGREIEKELVKAHLGDAAVAEPLLGAHVCCSSSRLHGRTCSCKLNDGTRIPGPEGT